MKIVVNPEHLRSIDGRYLIAGKRSPQIPPGIYEGDFNWEVAGHLAHMLKGFGHDAVLTYGPEQKKNMMLKHRVRAAEGADLFVSISANASPEPGWSKARGSVVFTNKSGFGVGQCIHETLGDIKEAIPQRFSRPRLHAGLYVLRRSPCPAVLIECGFMTNKDDVDFLASMHGKGCIARAIARGIEAWAQS